MLKDLKCKMKSLFHAIFIQATRCQQDNYKNNKSHVFYSE
jgi:hypothetical protein